MANPRNWLFLLCALLILDGGSFVQGAERKSKIKRLEGPATANLGKVAKLDLPEGYTFLDGKTTRDLMKSAGEPVSGDELGLVQPTNAVWSVLFEFSDVGYVKDDDKDKLNADKLLAEIKEGTAEANKERKRAGSAPLEIIGWEIPPKYNSETHNLEWAIRAKSEGQEILNYNTRLLGRKGVMEVVLIIDPESFEASLPAFRDLLTNYTFSTGNSYAEFRSGDKVAKYGLGALVLGGAAVGAAKLGLFTGLMLLLKKGWTLVIVAFAAVAAFFKKVFNKITGRSDDSG
jgi:uncharacterized membrane-anchored protein